MAVLAAAAFEPDALDEVCLVAVSLATNTPCSCLEVRLRPLTSEKLFRHARIQVRYEALIYLRKLSAKTAVPRLKSTDGSQEVDASEVWPQRFFEVKLGLCALP